MAEQAPAHPLSEIVAADRTCCLEELCLACRVEKDWVMGLVDYGIITPIAPERDSVTFSHLAVLEVARAARLERDLGLDSAGLAVALDLLAEIERLRARLNAATAALGSGPLLPESHHMATK